jgi:LysM repeat protein
MFSRLLVAALVAVPFVSSASATSCTRSYTVVAGDYCDAISAAHNVSTYQLAALNFPAVNAECTNLQVGQQLCLGIQGEDCQSTYVVQSGDSCEQVMNIFSVNATILSLNNPQINSDCTNIYVGEVLCVANQVLVPPAPSGVPVPTTPVITKTSAPAAPTKEPALPTDDNSDDEDLPFCDELDDDEE